MQKIYKKKRNQTKKAAKSAINLKKGKTSEKKTSEIKNMTKDLSTLLLL